MRKTTVIPWIITQKLFFSLPQTSASWRPLGVPTYSEIECKIQQQSRLHKGNTERENDGHMNEKKKTVAARFCAANHRNCMFVGQVSCTIIMLHLAITFFGGPDARHVVMESGSPPVHSEICSPMNPEQSGGSKESFLSPPLFSCKKKRKP